MYMPFVPQNAPKRFSIVNSLTGRDFFFSVVLPRTLFLRYLAVRILRADGELPSDASIIRALFFDRVPRKLNTAREHSIGFMYNGLLRVIVDTAGHTIEPV